MILRLYLYVNVHITNISRNIVLSCHYSVCHWGEQSQRCLEISEMNKLYRAFEGLCHLEREEYLKTFTAYTP